MIRIKNVLRNCFSGVIAHMSLLLTRHIDLCQISPDLPEATSATNICSHFTLCLVLNVFYVSVFELSDAGLQNALPLLTGFVTKP